MIVGGFGPLFLILSHLKTDFYFYFFYVYISEMHFLYSCFETICIVKSAIQIHLN